MQNFQALGLRPQTPKTAPHCEFLATRLQAVNNQDKKLKVCPQVPPEEPIPNTTEILFCLVIVITSLSTNYLDQKTAKGPFGLQVELPLANLYTTHGGRQL